MFAATSRKSQQRSMAPSPVSTCTPLHPYDPMWPLPHMHALHPSPSARCTVCPSAHPLPLHPCHSPSSVHLIPMTLSVPVDPLSAPVDLSCTLLLPPAPSGTSLHLPAPFAVSACSCCHLLAPSAPSDPTAPSAPGGCENPNWAWGHATLLGLAGGGSNSSEFYATA